MKIIASIENPAVIGKILADLGISAALPGAHPARAPPVQGALELN